ncbi:MAG: hypothetical protein ACJA01_003691 [Saprospiraceae bacterium]
MLKNLLQHTEGIQDRSYELLARIYKEHYKEGDSKEEEGEDQDPQLKAPHEIPSSSIQSIHDGDAAYRTKGHGQSKQTVAGFHANITETCEAEDDINLILDVEVVPANICEDAFLEASIDSSESILQEAHQTQDPQIEEAIADGGYDSIENRKEMLKEERCILRIAKTKGAKRVFEIEKTEDGDYTITHISTATQCALNYSEKKKKVYHPQPQWEQKIYETGANRKLYKPSRNRIQ